MIRPQAPAGSRRPAVSLMPVTDALAAVLAGAEPAPEEMVALDAAFHRVLARDVPALRTQPPQAMSAMDGYAVRAADAAAAGTHLKVIGEVAAGRPFDRTLGARRGGADLHRRRDPRGRRRRRDPGGYRGRWWGRHHHRGGAAGPACPPRRHRLSRGRRAAGRRYPPHRPRSVACRRHELSGACPYTAGPGSRCSPPATNW